MNHSEISEIKKLFQKTGCSITRIAGCYVAGVDRTIRTKLNANFLNMEEEEQFKYLEIFKKSLSGSIGKNLLNMEFTKEATEDGGVQASLLALRDSGLKDEALLDAFYQKIIEGYEYPGNFLILLAHDVYDVPVRTEDGILNDESDEMFSFVLCAICPVNLDKASLCYEEDTNSIKNRSRNWVVEMPESAFMFPSFNDRASDIYNILYYTKNQAEYHPELCRTLLGCEETTTYMEQKESFTEIIGEVLTDAREYDTFDVVRSIQSQLSHRVGQAVMDESEEPVMLGKEDVKAILMESGVKEEHLQHFDDTFEAVAGRNAEFDAASIATPKKIELKTDTLKIAVDREDADLIEIKVIDGRRCLVIPMDSDIEVNGIVKRIVEKLSEDE